MSINWFTWLARSKRANSGGAPTEKNLASDALDLRYPSSSQNDRDRASAVFSGAVVIYRALPAMLELVECIRDITRQALKVTDPCLAESLLESPDFRHRASCARQVVRENYDVASLYRAVLRVAGVDVSAAFYDHFKLRFQPSNDVSRTRYMRDLPVHRDTWGSNVHAQINWWAPIWPVTNDRTIGMFPALWDVPVLNTSADWSYPEFIRQLKADKNTAYPTLPYCVESLSPSDAVPVVIEPGDIMAFSGAHLHCSIPNQSGIVRISTETRTVSAHDLINSRSAKNVDCNAPASQFDWFHHIETGESLAHHLEATEHKVPNVAGSES